MNLSRLNIRYINLIALFLNIANISLGITYIIIGLNSMLLIFFSIALIIAWFVNISILLLNDHKFLRKSKHGALMNVFSYLFLIVQFFFVLMIAGGLFLLNADWISARIQYSLIYSGFFGYFLFGVILSSFNLKSLKEEDA
jgi:hypothetical protein